MGDKDLSTLNKKLALFIGFKSENYDDAYGLPRTRYYYPDGKIVDTAIDLVNDANSQVKWIYPKIANLPESIYGDTNFGIEWDSESRKYYAFIVITGMYDCTNENPALAFALAVEKLIDYLEKNNESSDK